MRIQKSCGGGDADELADALANITSNTTAAPSYNQEETIVAFWVCMGWSVVGVVFMFAAWQFARSGVETFDIDEPGAKAKAKPPPPEAMTVSASSGNL